MWHQHDFGSPWSADLPGFDGDSFARAPRVRPDRSGGGGGTAAPYISGDPGIGDASEYNIQITFIGTSWTAALRQAFISAADAISDFIVGDIPAAGGRRSPVDDLAITASLIQIDGPGNILGQAGPDAVRAGSYLPYKGTMQFDIADANAYQAMGLFDDIVLHEMLHTVGFGTIWDNLHLISGSGFNGALANAVYPAAGLIPLETGFGPGTDYSHWDEATFTNELMTGFINHNNDLSYMTIASLGDLGYSVVSGANYVPPTFI